MATKLVDVSAGRYYTINTKIRYTMHAFISNSQAMALFNIKAFKGKRIINMTYYKANY